MLTKPWVTPLNSRLYLKYPSVSLLPNASKNGKWYHPNYFLLVSSCQPTPCTQLPVYCSCSNLVNSHYSLRSLKSQSPLTLKERMVISLHRKHRSTRIFPSSLKLSIMRTRPHAASQLPSVKVSPNMMLLWISPFDFLSTSACAGGRKSWQRILVPNPVPADWNEFPRSHQ